VAVGEEVNEMQLAGWIGTSQIGWLHIPAWMGTWFSLFNNWQVLGGQLLAIAFVVGSYLAAQYVRVWGPRRRGGVPARMAQRPPERLVERPAGQLA
jgi:high-affinity iron transporter